CPARHGVLPNCRTLSRCKAFPPSASLDATTSTVTWPATWTAPCRSPTTSLPRRARRPGELLAAATVRPAFSASKTSLGSAFGLTARYNMQQDSSLGSPPAGGGGPAPLKNPIQGNNPPPPPCFPSC